MRDLFFKVEITAQSASYDLSHDLTSITVEEDDSLADKATVVVPDPFTVFSYALQEGMDVEIDLGYIDGHSVIFRGLITKVDAEFPENAVPTVTITAFDNIIRMGLRKRNRPWTETDLKAIVTSIANEAGYTLPFTRIDLPPGGNPTYTENGIRQCEQTDLAFLHDLAKAQHCKVFVDSTDAGDVFNFIAEQKLMDAEPATKLFYNRCGVENELLSFSVKSDVTRRKRPKVHASIDPETGKETETKQSLDTPLSLIGNPFDENLAELSARHPAKAAALSGLMTAAGSAFDKIFEDTGEEEREVIAGLHSSQKLKKETAPQESTATEGVTGEGVTAGNKDLRAKRNVQIEAVGGRFSGKWYLSQIRHVVNGSGYRTHFTCSR